MVEKNLFITYNYNPNDKASGIMRKILNEKKSLEKNNLCFYLTGESNNQFYIYDTNYSIKYKYKSLKNLYRINLLKAFINENKVKIVYIRYAHFSNYGFIKFLKFLKKRNIKIILEIPTYPYDKEYKKGFSKSYLKLLIDKVFRRKLKYYVDKIVTFSNDEKIWGIKCINILNGINLNDIKIIKKKDHKGIIFTSISSCEKWHGIDRFLFSLEAFKRKNPHSDVYFKIVGEGSETEYLKNIVKKSEILIDIVDFVGHKFGTELDEIYNITDIGIGSLARHRSGLTVMRALKNCEYAAKGIPMIFSEDDPGFRNVDFVYHVSATEELIDIEKVLQWFSNKDFNCQKIRNYAEKFSWDKQMKKVIENI